MKQSLTIVLSFILSITAFAQTVTDIDGNTYKTVVIRNQEWMAENLRVTHYPNGNPIPKNISDSTGAAYCWYDNDSIANANKYGALYTWSAAMDGKVSSAGNPSGIQGVCPDGWHLPSWLEWFEIFEHGDKLKDTTGWNNNGNGTNELGFTACPGGIGHSASRFYHKGNAGYWASSQKWEEWDTNYIHYFYMHYSGDMEPTEGIETWDFTSVRCVKGNSESNAPYKPIIGLPKNDKDSVPIYTTLSWSCTDPEHDKLNFDVYLDTIDASTIVSNMQTDTTFTPQKLMNNKTYYWKIIARDSHGNDTIGDVWSFTTIPEKVTNGQGVTDFDGQTYKTVVIGNQEWMAENLRVTHYADGVDIPKVADNEAWGNLGIDSTHDAFCWYLNDSINYSHYGAYYTWAAATHGNINSSSNPSNVQGVCPTGWHLPSRAEWNELLDYVKENASENKTAFALKSTDLWNDNKNGSNEFGFNAYPYSFRSYYNGEFVDIGQYGYWWSCEPYGAESDNFIYDSIFAYNLNIWDSDNEDLFLNASYYTNAVRSAGFTVRCLKNDNQVDIIYDKKTLAIYPNPAKETIYLLNSEYVNSIMNIYDIQGRQVLSKKINSKSIDISSLGKGLYIIQIVNNKRKSITKLIVE